MVKQSKPGALALAEKASKLAPDRRRCVATRCALALASPDQSTRAVELQKQSVARWPGDPSLRLTMARLHLQAGDKKQARSELEELSKLGKKFPEHAEVAELLKSV